MRNSRKPYTVGVHALACWPLGTSTLKRELQRGSASNLQLANRLVARDERYRDSHKSIPRQPWFRIKPTAFHNKAQGRGTHPGYAVLRHPTPTGLHNGRELWNPVGVQPCNNLKPRVRVATLGFVVEPRCGSHPPIGNDTKHPLEASVHAVTRVATGSRIGDNADMLRRARYTSVGITFENSKEPPA